MHKWPFMFMFRPKIQEGQKEQSSGTLSHFEELLHTDDRGNVLLAEEVALRERA